MNARILCVAFVLCSLVFADELEQSSKSAITPPPKHKITIKEKIKKIYKKSNLVK